MKKLLSLFSLVMLFALAANAASGDGYRRTWDFRTGWSATTVAKLEADAIASSATIGSGDAHWQVQGTGFQNSKAMTKGPAQVWVDGVAEDIPELSGMTINALGTAKHFQIVTTYSGVKDTPCIWINGKNSGTDEIIVTVPAGENVKFGYCTHKNGEARGFKTGSAGFADADGKTQWTTTDNTTISEVELINSNTQDAQLKLAATNGSHLYYLIIGEGDAPTSSKVGIVYSAQNGGKSLEELAIYAALNGTDGMTLEGVNIDDANPTADQLKAYDAIILDNSLPVDNDLVAALKPNVQWQPTLNLNAPLAAAFGYGTLVNCEVSDVLIDNVKKTWFASLIKNEQVSEIVEGSGQYFYTVNNGEGNFGALNISEGLHKAESSLASAFTQPDDTSYVRTATSNYVHNLGYNEYVFYGTNGSEFSEVSTSVLQSIISELVSSKSDVKQCTKPSAKGIYKEMESKVVLSDIVKGATIYYTTDGTEPTQESPVYNGDTLTFTQEATIKAIAIADGYTLSDVMSFDVKLYHQAKAPVVTVEGGGANRPATIKLSSEDGENVKIYYNFTGANTISASSEYADTVALVMKHSGTITAFAVAASDDIALVQSETTSQDVNANTSHDSYKQVAHFTGKGWNTVTNLAINGTTMEKWSNTSNYFFSWGKTARASFENSDEPKLDDQGNPVFDGEGNPVYETKYLDPDTTTCSTDPVWKCLSSGQVMLYQSNSLTAVVGDGNGYNPERAEDYDKDATNEDIQMGAKVSGDRYTARIESTAKYAAPFDVKVIAATTTGSAEKIAIQVSENGVDWKTIGDTCACSATKRLYKKFEASYPGGNDVFVRVAHIATGSGVSIHDIFINQGEPAVVNPDTDNNGVVNMDDVQNVLNVILTGKIVEGINADANGDSEVNVLDLNVVINAMIK